MPLDLISGGQAPPAPQVRELLDQLRATRDIPTRDTAAMLADLGLQPMRGGRNNEVFQWTAATAPPVCVKLYSIDQRQRAEREWAALIALADHDVPGVPRPLWRLDDPALPVIGMTLLPGAPLGELADSLPAMAALPRLLRAIHEVPPPALFARLARVDPATRCVERINQDWAARLLQQEGDALTSELSRLLSRWQRSDDQRLVTEPTRRSLVRGDGNLDNWLWDGRRISVVDFEYGGPGDPVFDAADLVEHISARAVPDAAWDEVADDLGMTSGATAPRFAAARRTCALWWLAVLWKYRASREQEFADQLDRVRALDRQRR